MKLTSILYFTVLVLFMSANPAISQKNSIEKDWEYRPVKIELSSVKFTSAIEILCKKTGKCIIADGEPFTETANLSFEGNGKEAVDKVADIFDYKWKLSKSGVILFSKKFHLPEERPQSNPEEILNCSYNVLSILQWNSNGNSFKTTANYLVELANSLTQEQINLLHRGDHLQVNELTANQQSLVFGSILSNSMSQTEFQWNLLKTLLSKRRLSNLKINSKSEFNKSTNRQETYHFMTFNFTDGHSNPRIEIFNDSRREVILK